MPSVSCVIVTRDRRQLLERSVASVIRYCPPETEIIVVDNASEDDTWQWLTNQTRVRALRSDENRGPGPGRNLGIRVAQGEFILFLDDDAYLVEPIIQRGLEELGRSEQVGAVAFPIWEATLGRLIYGGVGGPRKVFAAGGALFKKEALEAAGLFDESIRWSEEFHLSVRMRAAGFRIVGTEGPYVMHQAATSVKHHSAAKLRQIAAGRLRSFLTSFRWPAAMIMSGRVLLGIGWAGLRNGHLSPAPLALLDTFRDWPEILNSRVVVPRDVEDLFFEPNPGEDEFSVPFHRKAWARVSRLRARR